MPYPTQWANYDPNIFMCCLCFALLNIKECSRNDSGELEDVCIECWYYEKLSPYLHGL